VDHTFAPDGLAADAGPIAGFEPRHKGGEISGCKVISDFAGEASEWVHITGAGTAAESGLMGEVAAGEGDRAREVEQMGRGLKGLAAVEFAEGAEALVDSSEEDVELGAVDEGAVVLELGGGLELDNKGLRGGGCGIKGFRGKVYGEEVRVDIHEFAAAATGSDAFFGKLAEGLGEVGKEPVAGVEQVEVDMKGLALLEGAVVEMGGSKDEGAGRIGTFVRGFRFGAAGAKEMAIGVRGKGESKGSADGVRGFSGGESERIEGFEGEANQLDSEEVHAPMGEASMIRR
jgi:hypothetical protein